ncbi:MAG: hypothetical protein ACXVBO_22030 [Isosphaeraceae bacterium]
MLHALKRDPQAAHWRERLPLKRSSWTRLPTGLTFHDNGNRTATITRTAAATAGTTPLTINATNGVGSPTTQTFTLTVS